MDLITPEGGRIAAPESVARWWRLDEHIIADEGNSERRGPNPQWDERPLHSAILSMSTLVLEGGAMRAELRYPDEPDQAPWEHALQYELGDTGAGVTYVLPYAGELCGVLCADYLFSSLNREHPLVQKVLSSQYTAEKSDTGRFAEEFFYSFANHRALLAAAAEEGYADREELRYVGSLYRMAEREGMPANMRPPYRLWSSEFGMVEIHEEQLKRWAEANWRR